MQNSKNLRVQNTKNPRFNFQDLVMDQIANQLEILRYQEHFVAVMPDSLVTHLF